MAIVSTASIFRHCRVREFSLSIHSKFRVVYGIMGAIQTARLAELLNIVYSFTLNDVVCPKRAQAFGHRSISENTWPRLARHAREQGDRAEPFYLSHNNRCIPASPLYAAIIVCSIHLRDAREQEAFHKSPNRHHKACGRRGPKLPNSTAEYLSLDRIWKQKPQVLANTTRVTS